MRGSVAGLPARQEKRVKFQLLFITATLPLRVFLVFFFFCPQPVIFPAHIRSLMEIRSLATQAKDEPRSDSVTDVERDPNATKTLVKNTKQGEMGFTHLKNQPAVLPFHRARSSGPFCRRFAKVRSAPRYSGFGTYRDTNRTPSPWTFYPFGSRSMRSVRVHISSSLECKVTRTTRARRQRARGVNADHRPLHFLASPTK